MKKRALTIAAAAFVVLAMASCKKCKDCHYDLAGTEVEIGEFCDDDLAEVEANGYALNDSVTVTVHCEEH